jgi:DNA-binding CsgD family transcriptional regulator
MIDTLPDAAKHVLMHFTNHCHVLIRGTRGSGKSRTLDVVHERLSVTGTVGIMFVPAGTAPLASISRHPSAGRPMADHAHAVRWLTDELGTRGSALLVDDIDLIDSASLEVFAEVLRTTPGRLIAVARSEPTRTTSTALARLLVRSAPLVVRIDPLDVRDVLALMADTLGAPVGMRLTAEVLSQTGGNPRAVIAVSSAARSAGAIELSDGAWSGELGDSHLDAVALSSLPELEPDQRDALELLACAGPLPADRVHELVCPTALDALTDDGLVVHQDVPDEGLVLAVSPPALAQALRSSADPLRRRRFSRRLRDHPAPYRGVDVLPATATWSAARDDETTTAQAVAMTRERTGAQILAARDRWRDDLSVAAANDYLRLVLQQSATTDAADEVFTHTHVEDSTCPDELTRFSHYEAQLGRWRGTSPRRVLERVADHATPDGGLTAALAVEVGVAALLEAGHLHEARRCAESELARTEEGTPEAHRLAALVVESLLLLADVTEAERRARTNLLLAHRRADILGVRVHASVLAEVCFFAGRGQDAWAAVVESLHLGAAGPLDAPSYRRGLAIGAILQANHGDEMLARTLLRELTGTGQPSDAPSATLSVLTTIAAAVLAPRSVDTPGAMWNTGLHHLEQGRLVPALLAWIPRPGVLSAAEARTMRLSCSSTTIPLFVPYLQLHQALAGGDLDGDPAYEGVHRTVAPFLAKWTQQEPDALTASARGSKYWGPQPLTSREAEVAQLAADDLTNADIADQLSISIRTVENHIARAMRKSGARNRHQVAAVSARNVTATTAPLL